MLKKRWISIITLAVMLISLLACFALPSTAADSNTKHYYISTEAQWNAAAAITTAGYWDNVVLHLRGDINFHRGESTAVTPKSFAQAFSGILEGGGYTIKNATFSNSLFPNGITGTVKDLYIDDSVTFTKSNTGILASSLSGTVQRVGIRAVVTGSNVYAISYSGSGSITECFFSGTGATGLARTGTITNSVCGNTAYTNKSETYGSIQEAAYHVNRTGAVYFTYGYSGEKKDDRFRFGTERDHIVQVTIGEEVSYHEAGDEIALAMVPDVVTAVRTAGNGYIQYNFNGKGDFIGQTLVVRNQDTTIVYQDAAAVAKAQGKAELEELIAVYENPIFIENKGYFTEDGWNNMQTWLSEAKALVEANTATGKQFHDKFVAGRSVKVVDDLDWIPGKYYSLYQYFPSILDFSVSDAEDWKALVDASNLEKLELTQYTNGNFRRFYHAQGLTLHLTRDIDMSGVEMLPLCYGHKFAGRIDGHGFGFKNINIDIESPFGPVGLVGIQDGTSVIQNLRVEGSITVKGHPIFISDQIGSGYVHEGNRVGGIAGNASGGSVTRKCLADVAFSVQHAGNCGGILGDARGESYVDGCIALGETHGIGIVGEGGASCRISNSIYGGNSGIIKYHRNIMGALGDDMSKRIQNCYSFMAPIVWRGVWTDAEGNDLWNDATTATVNAFTKIHQSGSIAEAAYKANNGYVAATRSDGTTPLGDGERIYFTLDANGNPTFGTETNQIIKIYVKDQSNQVVDTYYGASSGEVKLNHEMGRNFYAIENGENLPSYIRGQTLYTVNAADGLTLKTATDVDSGNAYGTDSAINLMDAQMVLRASVGLNTELVDALAGDVNFNDKLDVNDAVLIVRHWMGDKSWYNSADHAITDMEGWFTVASYNIKVLNWDGGVEGGDTYYSDNDQEMPLLEEVAAVIESVGEIDLLGLQEVNWYGSSNSNLTKLAGKVGGTWNNRFTWGRKGSTWDQYGTGIMTPHTINTTESEARHQYDMQYGVINSDSVERRAYGRFEIEMDDGTEIIWYNTHLGTVVEQQLAELMEDVKADYASGENKNIIITGDFNMWPTEMKRYLGEHFTMANGDTQGNSYVSTATLTGTVIDNIIISDTLEFYVEEGYGTALNVVKYENVPNAIKTQMGCSDETNWASDHNLVYAYVRVKK